MRLYALAAVLILAAVGLEVHRRGVVTRERSRFGLLRDDVELFVDALATSVRNPESCLDLFKGRRPPPGATAPVTLDYVYDPARPGPLAAGGEAWAGTTLRKLTLTLPDEPDMRTRVKGRDLRRYRARLDAEFAVGERFARGVPSGLDVILWLNAAGEVDACFGSLSVGSVCNMMGGYYDVHARPPEPRCHQVVETTVGVGDARVYRGSCRVSAVVDRVEQCHPRRGALSFQDRVGYGTSSKVLCRVCE